MESDVATTTPLSPADDPRTADAVLRARAEHDRTLERLLELLRIPSVSTKVEHASDCREAAAFLRDELDSAGLERAEVLETGGLPAVYAEWLHAPEGAPTVLLYGHYD